MLFGNLATLSPFSAPGFVPERIFFRNAFLPGERTPIHPSKPSSKNSSEEPSRLSPALHSHLPLSEQHVPLPIEAGSSGAHRVCSGNLTASLSEDTTGSRKRGTGIRMTQNTSESRVRKADSGCGESEKDLQRPVAIACGGKGASWGLWSPWCLG